MKKKKVSFTVSPISPKSFARASSKARLGLSYAKETTFSLAPAEPDVMTLLDGSVFMISVTVTPQEMATIRHLVGEGLHGRSAGEVCERLVARELERVIYPRKES